MTHEMDRADALLLEALRSADDTADDAALSRVRQRLYEAAKPRVLAASRAARRPRWGARGGLVSALLVGTALGAGGHAVVSYVVAPRAVEVTPIVASAPANRPPGSVASRGPARDSASDGRQTPADVASPPPTATPPRSVAVTSARSTPPDFDAELRGLEDARRALGAGDAATALALLARHAERYPKSMLVQEREALVIKALVGAGRRAEARAAAERFVTKYPRSLLLDSVTAAVGSIP
jgi:hypothetical protein